MRRLSFPGALALLIAALPAATPAVTIGAAAQGQVGSTVRSDTRGPATSGELLASAEFPEAWDLAHLGMAVARAAQNDAGTAAVVADGAFRTDAVSELLATTSWSESVTNNGSRTTEYVYEFTITPPKLTLADQRTSTGGPAVASWAIVVRLDGNAIFTASAELAGTAASHVLTEAGTDLGGTFFGNVSGTPFGYQFDRFEGVLSLGFYEPGESLAVETTLETFATAPRAGLGARAEIGDPLDIDGDPGVNGVIIMSDAVAIAPSTWSATKALYRD